MRARRAQHHRRRLGLWTLCMVDAAWNTALVQHLVEMNLARVTLMTANPGTSVWTSEKVRDRMPNVITTPAAKGKAPPQRRPDRPPAAERVAQRGHGEGLRGASSRRTSPVPTTRCRGSPAGMGRSISAAARQVQLPGRWASLRVP